MEISAAFAHEKSKTPCMVAFEKWWADNANAYAKVGAMDAWRIFMQGWWAAEDK